MKRIFLFLLTNLAILVVLGVVLQLLGVEGILDEAGIGLDYPSRLVFAAVFGMGGSLLSLAFSKWTAKRLTGATVIQRPRNHVETWLFESVSRHARTAGIGRPSWPAPGRAWLHALPHVGHRDLLPCAGRRFCTS